MGGCFARSSSSRPRRRTPTVFPRAAQVRHDHTEIVFKAPSIPTSRSRRGGVGGWGGGVCTPPIFFWFFFFFFGGGGGLRDSHRKLETEAVGSNGDPYHAHDRHPSAKPGDVYEPRTSRSGLRGSSSRVYRRQLQVRGPPDYDYPPSLESKSKIELVPADGLRTLHETDEEDRRPRSRQGRDGPQPAASTGSYCSSRSNPLGGRSRAPELRSRCQQIMRPPRRPRLVCHRLDQPVTESRTYCRDTIPPPRHESGSSRRRHETG